MGVVVKAAVEAAVRVAVRAAVRVVLDLATEVGGFFSRRSFSKSALLVAKDYGETVSVCFIIVANKD